MRPKIRWPMLWAYAGAGAFSHVLARVSGMGGPAELALIFLGLVASWLALV